MKAIVANGSKADRFSIISERPARLGEYFVAHTGDGDVLGMVEESIITSAIMEKARDYITASEAEKFALSNARDRSYTSLVRVVGLVDSLKKGKPEMPSLPPEPGTIVEEAPEDLLKAVFSYGIQIGSLLRKPSVRVGVNIDAVASRHLAILGATGSGKSNLLALIAKEVMKLGGTMVIFDYHGEYSSLKGAVQIRAKINPRILDADELADVIEIRRNASKQREALARALTQQVRSSKDFWDDLEKNLIDDNDEGLAARVIEIIERARRRLGKILDTEIGDPINMVKPNKVNVIDMLDLNEAQSSLIISYYASEILEQRKAFRRNETENIIFDTPVILALEEAHAFLPEGEESDAHEIISKVAREGRKFGVGLIVASQRPSRLSQDVLSQMGSIAVFRISQPRDQSYIVESSELVSAEVAAGLPSLNSGEAILLGQWVKLPTVAKIDMVEEKLVGSDYKATEEWARKKKMSEVAEERTDELILY
ncbi:MAG: ATP-binding protein [Nitrososphaeria archaeon]